MRSLTQKQRFGATTRRFGKYFFHPNSWKTLDYSVTYSQSLVFAESSSHFPLNVPSTSIDLLVLLVHASQSPQSLHLQSTKREKSKDILIEVSTFWGPRHFESGPIKRVDQHKRFCGKLCWFSKCKTLDSKYWFRILIEI